MSLLRPFTRVLSKSKSHYREKYVLCLAVDNNNFYIVSKWKTWEKIPSTDFELTSEIRLSCNLFQNCGLREIIKLTLNHNSVQTIGLHSFVGLPHLQWLDLSGNSLYQILPWTFYDNKNLRFINLSENPLGHITHTGPLLNVPSLEVIKLFTCLLCVIASKNLKKYLGPL